MTTDVTPAYVTLMDELESDVLLRVHGMLELGGPTPGSGVLKECVLNDAENGRDPFKNGTVEVGLLMPLEPYEDLVEYAKGLTVVKAYGKRRKRS